MYLAQNSTVSAKIAHFRCSGDQPTLIEKSRTELVQPLEESGSPRRGPKAPEIEGRLGQRNGPYRRKRACSSCRPPVAQTTRIHRISANLPRPLLALHENAKSPE